jgi:hypothetical protein
MVSFYIWPSLAVGLVVAARLGRLRFAAAAVAAAAITVMSQWHLGELLWWSIMTAGIVAVLSVGVGRVRLPIPSEPSGLSVVSPGREPSRVLVGSAPA